jgi:hypothetical protein
MLPYLWFMLLMLQFLKGWLKFKTRGQKVKISQPTLKYVEIWITCVLNFFLLGNKNNEMSYRCWFHGF